MTELQTLDLGSRKIRIPYARLEGNSTGPTVCITAGNDGDEYAGVKAAYRIIEEFSNSPFYGTLLVFPVINIPGFDEEKSANPLDGVYPKHVYPGKPNGTPSERLRYWLSGFVSRSDFWIDLHGGSLTERVNPYVHAWKSHALGVDRMIESILSVISSDIIVYRDVPDYVRDLGKSGCGYLMCESGSFCDISGDAVSRHLKWIRSVMAVLGMIDGHTTKTEKRIYTNVHEYTIRKNGIWFSDFPDDNRIVKGMHIGDVRSFDGKILETITAKQDGVLLWAKEGMRAKKGDCVLGVGY